MDLEQIFNGIQAAFESLAIWDLYGTLVNAIETMLNELQEALVELAALFIIK